MADLADSAMAFRAVARQLPDDGWRFPVRVLDSRSFPAGELLIRRLVEVELHHCDLGIGYGHTMWPEAFTAMDLGEPMRSQRADRLTYVQPPQAARAGASGRPPAAWKPGQRLPGSWIGRG